MISDRAVINEVPFDRNIIRNELPDLALALRDAEIHPTAYIGPFVGVCRGITQPTRIGARTMIEGQTMVGHDAQIEEDVEIASRCGIGGYAIIRKGAKLGTGADVLPYVCIGEGAVVGAGAVVTRHVKAGMVVAGVPAEPILPRSSEVSRNAGKLRCGCSETEVWDGCPHHGLQPVC